MKCEEINPQSVWRILTAIYGEMASGSPHKSIRDRIMGWLSEEIAKKKIHLEITEDSIGNIFIKKPAFPGCDDIPSLLLQAHFDIHDDLLEKTRQISCSSINLDANLEWFEILGSPILDDSVVGVALILSVLTDTTGEIRHGPLETLLTVKKGSQFLGALQLDPSVFNIQSKFLLNFDAVDLGSIIDGTAGCAEFIFKKNLHYLDGIDTSPFRYFQLGVEGLLGGDLGSEIHFIRANALKLAARCVSPVVQSSDLFLGQWGGGMYFRFIPQSCNMSFALPRQKSGELLALIQEERAHIVKKYKKFSEYGQNLEPNIRITLEETKPFPIIGAATTSEIITLANWIPQGLIQKSAAENEIGKTSNNFAKITTSPQEISFYCKTRGDNTAELDFFNRKMRAVQNFGWKVINEYDFPVWEPSPSKNFLAFVKHIFEDVLNHPISVNRSYWVLEPGAIREKIPQLEVLSIGPTEMGVFPANYKVKVSDVWILYQILKEILVKLREFPPVSEVM